MVSAPASAAASTVGSGGGAYAPADAKSLGTQTAATQGKALTKQERSFYLLMQLLNALFSLGYYILFADVRPTGGFLCTVAARGTLAIFYKPILPAMWYGLMHLMDDEGWMLEHEIFNDTVIAEPGSTNNFF